MQAPHALTDLQDWLTPLLQRPHHTPYSPSLIQEARLRIKPSPTLLPEKRLHLYNEQIWLRFFNLLQKDYPTLFRLFGPRDFNALVEPYLQAHWPIHPSLALLGSHLPDFLSAHYQEEDRRLILPLAILDCAYHRLKHAPPPFALFELNADLIAFRTALLKSPHEHWIDHDLPPIAWNSPQHILLFTHNNTFHTEPLPPAAFRLLSALHQGASLPDAISSLSPTEQTAAEPHIFSWFERWASLGFFEGLRP